MRTRWTAMVAIVLVLTGCNADPQHKDRAAEPVAEVSQPEPKPEETSEPKASDTSTVEPDPEPTQDQEQSAGPEAGEGPESQEPTTADPGPQERSTTEPEPITDPEPTTSPPEPPAPDYDTEWAQIYAGYIVEDIITADERFLDRPQLGGGTTMMFLSGNMEDLLNLGIPPGVNEAEYYALVTTLGEFFDRAREELREGQVMEATATYLTARAHTGDLLDMLNPVLGTSHQLPPSPFG